MAVNLLQWFMTKMAAYTGGKLTRADMTRLFYPAHREAQMAVDSAFGGNNNGKSLFTPAVKSSSGWQSQTLAAARAIEADGWAAAARLCKACPESFFREVLSFEDDLKNERSESRHADYADSRLRVWAQALCGGGLSQEGAAYVVAMLFAESVYGLEQKGLRQGGSLLISQMAQGALVPAGSNIGRENVYLTARHILEKQVRIEEMLRGASTVRMFNITAIGLIYGHENPQVDYKRGIFEECLHEGTRFAVVLPKPGSLGEADAGTYKLRSGYGGRQGIDMIRHTRHTLIDDIRRMEREGKKGQIELRYADCAPPYALMIVTFDEEPQRDHIKVDLLSPYLDEDLDRRSFYIFREQDPENYDFFLRNFNSIFKQAISFELFEEMERRQS